MIVYRGESRWHESIPLKVGEKIKTKYFTSTSAQLSKVEEWINKSKTPLIIKYILKEGTPAAPLIDIGFEFDYQCEFTLPQGLEGEIVAIDRNYKLPYHDSDYFVNDTATLVTVVI